MRAMGRVTLVLACLLASGCLDFSLKYEPEKPPPAFHTRDPIEDPGPALLGPDSFWGQIVFSADGAEVLYSKVDMADDGTASTSLHALRVADGSVRDIDTKGASVDRFAPAANGTALFVIVVGAEAPGVFEATSGVDVPVALEPIDIVAAPSGRRLLLAPRGDGTAEGQMWRVFDLDSGILRTTPCAETVTFSPGSDEIACAPMYGSGIARERLSDGVTTTLPGLRDGWSSEIRWSEEGIVVANFDYPVLVFGDPTTGVVSARSAGGPHLAVGAGASFSGDGRAAIFEEHECLARLEGVWECSSVENRLMMADLASGAITTLASSTEDLGAFAISPDGTTAAYAYCSQQQVCVLHVRPTGR